MIKKYFIQLFIKIGVGIASILIAVLLFYIFFYHTHSYGEWKILKDASCFEKGIEQRECKCGSYESRYTPMTKHTEGEWVTDETENERRLLCSVCQTILQTETLYDHIHSWSDWITEKPSTCTENGILSRSCACGARDEMLIAVSEHCFGKWEILIEPECEIAGSRARYCNCGETETEEIPPLEHCAGDWTFNEDKSEKHFLCINCGKILETEQIKYSEGLEIKDGIVMGIGTCTDTDIIIPYAYDGKEITAIAEKAFYKSQNIERITLPETVTSVGEKAFWQCTNLKHINLENVTEIEKSAFAHCISLQSITLNPSIKKLEMSILECCESLTDIYFGGTVQAWNYIPKNKYWDEYTNAYTVHCSDGDISAKNDN